MSTYLKILSKYLYDHKVSVIYIFSCFLILLISRWPTILYPLTLNIDEMQMTANAMRMYEYGYSWDAVDATTSGPYNSLILMWPYLLGFDITTSTIRFTALMLIFGTLVYLYKTIIIFSSRTNAVIFSIPLVIIFSLTINNDFVHYSSELLSIFIVVLTMYLLIDEYTSCTTRAVKFKKILLTGFLIGIIPFAKLQAAPLALVNGLFGAFIIYKYSKNKPFEIIIYSFVSLVPALILFIPLFLTGGFHHFIISYIMLAFFYAPSSTSLSDFYALFSGGKLYYYTNLATICFSLFVIVFHIYKFKHKGLKNIDILIYALLLFVTSLYIVVKPGKLFPHYLTFTIPFILLFFSLLCGAIIDKYKKPMAVIFLIFLAGFLNFTVIEKTQSLFMLYKNISGHQKFQIKNPSMLSWLPGNDKLMVWGWMPQWYIMSNKIPATRETQTSMQIRNSDYLDYYRTRLLDDLSSASPSIIIDSTTGRSFHFNDNKKYGLHTFPELHQFVNRNYIQLPRLNHFNQECPYLYLSKKDYKKFNQKNINFSLIETNVGTINKKFSETFHVRNLNDYSTSEDSCIDYWLLPYNTLAKVKIDFEFTEKVKEVVMLNTNNSNNLNASTKKIKLTLYNQNKQMFEKILYLEKHPQPTSLILENTVTANQLLIEILEFDGLAAGLNEVKVFRDIK